MYAYALLGSPLTARHVGERTTVKIITFSRGILLVVWSEESLGATGSIKFPMAQVFIRLRRRTESSGTCRVCGLNSSCQIAWKNVWRMETNGSCRTRLLVGCDCHGFTVMMLRRNERLQFENTHRRDLRKMRVRQSRAGRVMLVALFDCKKMACRHFARPNTTVNAVCYGSENITPSTNGRSVRESREIGHHVACSFCPTRTRVSGTTWHDGGALLFTGYRTPRFSSVPSARGIFSSDQIQLKSRGSAKRWGVPRTPCRKIILGRVPGTRGGVVPAHSSTTRHVILRMNNVYFSKQKNMFFKNISFILYRALYTCLH